MADDEYDLTCLIEGDKSTFSVLAPRTASVSVLRRLIRQEGELDRFNFRVLDLTLLKVHRKIDVVNCLTDLLVFQVEIDLKPLLGRISQFKLNSRLHHSVTLDDSSFPLSELWEEQPPARHIHIFVRLPSRDADQGQLLPSFQRRTLALPLCKIYHVISPFSPPREPLCSADGPRTIECCRKRRDIQASTGQTPNLQWTSLRTAWSPRHSVQRVPCQTQR